MTNLGYSKITSPVDGTVISRAVDEGQTVAASYNTPTLFEKHLDIIFKKIISDFLTNKKEFLKIILED